MESPEVTEINDPKSTPHNPNPPGKKANRPSMIVKRAWKKAGKPEPLKVWARKLPDGAEAWFENK